MTQVLITRPLEASQQLAGRLDDLGFVPIVMPFYRFSALQPTVDFSSAWSGTEGRKLAVFTSPRAVHFGLPLITQNQLNDLEFAVVGSASGAALKAAGHPQQLQADTGYTSEDLLQIPGLATQPGAAVIFCAPGGRAALKTGLSDLGWELSEAMVYERVALEPAREQLDALSNANKLVSIWTSVSALTIAQQNLPADLWAKILQAPSLVISKRIRHHLKSLGATRVSLSEGPGNDALLKAVTRMGVEENPD
jgi:uroporphyrinogen-III synthase